MKYMKSSASTCSGCYWNGQCDCECPCDDFTPLEQQDDLEFYQEVLAENKEEYCSFVEEMDI